MPRDSGGTYSLPAGNPVVTLTVISSSWANTTMSDLATALTGSLDRSGNGGMLAGLKLFSGTSGAPGLTWSSETTSGLYRSSAGVFNYVIGSADLLQLAANLVGIFGTDPAIRITEQDAAANNKVWELAVIGEQLRFRVASDVFSYVNWLTVDRTGTVIDTINFANGTLQAGGNLVPNVTSTPTWTGKHIFSAVSSGGVSGGFTINLESSTPGLQWLETDAAANNQIWQMFVNGEQFIFRLGEGASQSIMTVDRTAGAVDTVNFPNGILNLSNPLRVADGTSAAPSFSFSADTDVGIYRAAANQMAFSTGGVGRMAIADTFIDVSGGQLRLGDGTIGTPGLGFLNDTDTGFFRNASNDLRVSAGGVLVGQWLSTGQYVLAQDGAVGGPAVSFVSDTDTGIYRIAANRIGVAVGGANIFDASATVIALSAPLFQVQGIHNGTAPSGTNDYVASGTYTPTVSNTSNVSANTPRVCQWLRVGRVVTVSGDINITPTGAGATLFELSLPIASTLSASNQLAGTGATANPTVVLVRRSSNNARCEFTAAGAPAVDLSFTFTYLVN